MAKRRITQETFDAAVKENMEEFEMDPDEALREAVEQFESQGNIATKDNGWKWITEHVLLLTVDGELVCRLYGDEAKAAHNNIICMFYKSSERNRMTQLIQLKCILSICLCMIYSLI